MLGEHGSQSQLRFAARRISRGSRRQRANDAVARARDGVRPSLSMTPQPVRSVPQSMPRIAHGLRPWPYYARASSSFSSMSKLE